MSVVPNNVTDSDYSVLIGYYLDCVTSRIVLWAGHRGRRLDQSQLNIFFKSAIIHLSLIKSFCYTTRPYQTDTLLCLLV